MLGDDKLPKTIIYEFKQYHEYHGLGINYISWPNITEIAKSKNYDHKPITLASDEHFSNEFTSLLGNNAFNIQALPDEWFQVDCVDSLADCMAFYQLQRNQTTGEFGYFSNFNNGETRITISTNLNGIAWTAWHNGLYNQGIGGTSLMLYMALQGKSSEL
jgi:hypothetical protein